jgi:quinol monooxygenase YgiN
MYGLIGKMLAAPGKREELLAILLDDKEPMPECLSYIVARDPASADGIWVTEVWTDAASHAASLHLPHVQAMIGKARPMIAGFAERFETEPLGGVAGL